MAVQVKVYTTQYCPHCTRVKRLLQSKNISFEEIDFSQNDTLRDEMQKKTGWMTVPMIFIGEKFIGGADELFSLEATGKLDQNIA